MNCTVTGCFNILLVWGSVDNLYHLTAHLCDAATFRNNFSEHHVFGADTIRATADLLILIHLQHIQRHAHKQKAHVTYETDDPHPFPTPGVDRYPSPQVTSAWRWVLWLAWWGKGSPPTLPYGFCSQNMLPATWTRLFCLHIKSNDEPWMLCSFQSRNIRAVYVNMHGVWCSCMGCGHATLVCVFCVCEWWSIQSHRRWRLCFVTHVTLWHLRPDTETPSPPAAADYTQVWLIMWLMEVEPSSTVAVSPTDLSGPRTKKMPDSITSLLPSMCLFGFQIKGKNLKCVSSFFFLFSQGPQQFLKMQFHHWSLMPIILFCSPHDESLMDEGIISGKYISASLFHIK